MTVIYTVIGKKVKKYREQKKITQFKLSELCDLDRSAIVYIEKGKQKVSIEKLYKISSVLNVKITDLLPTDSELKSLTDIQLSFADNQVKKVNEEIEVQKGIESAEAY